VVALAPLTLIMKQTNYITIFCAPLAILAGWLLSRLPRAWLTATLTAVLLGSFVLAALEQQAVKVFTANSKATVAFAQQHGDATVYGTVNALMAGIFYDRLLTKQASKGARLVEPLADLVNPSSRNASDATARRDRPRFAIVDLQTLDWGDNGLRTLLDVPPCWRRIGQLEPVREGAGRWIANALLAAANAVSSPNGAVVRALAGVTEIRPAWIFDVPGKCAAAGDR